MVYSGFRVYREHYVGVIRKYRNSSNGVQYGYNSTLGVWFNYGEITNYDLNYVTNGMTYRLWATMAYAMAVRVPTVSLALFYLSVADINTSLLVVNTTTLMKAYAAMAYDHNISVSDIGGYIENDTTYISDVPSRLYGSRVYFNHLTAVYSSIGSSDVEECESLLASYYDRDYRIALLKNAALSVRYTGKIACHRTHAATGSNCQNAASIMPHGGWNSGEKISYSWGDCAIVRYRY
ncbi:hypothetical protein V1511DRAFT_494487, partial [Dipodascopsis uninucleata]